MGTPNDTSNSSNADSPLDPFIDPNLPVGRWKLSALSFPHNGCEDLNKLDAGWFDDWALDNSEQPAWDPPKFQEPRTVPKGWDVSSFK